MEKEFIPYEQALVLKELGFDEPCFKYVYIGDTGNNFDHYLEVEPSKAKNYNEDDLCISQPTYSAAFRWFREKYNIHHSMRPVVGSKNGYDSYPILGWESDIFATNQGTQNSYYMGYPVCEWFTATLDNFDEGDTLKDLNLDPLKYEEAELKCLKNIIKYVKKEKLNGR